MRWSRVCLWNLTTLIRRCPADYVQMQNTLDPLRWENMRLKLRNLWKKPNRTGGQLEENIAAYYAYAEPQVAAEEQAYQEKLRQEEIERKLKENTGKISVAGAGKSMTVTRDIEDIEKSETLTEQEKIPVLDFSSKGNENVIIKQGDKTTVKKPENKEGVLRRTDGKNFSGEWCNSSEITLVETFFCGIILPIKLTLLFGVYDAQKT